MTTAPRPLVSVIIIFLNEERFLGEAVASVRAQTWTDWELILVDDGSTDGSTHIAKEAAQADPARVRYCEHEGHANRGMSAARNLGVSVARGELVAFLDGDDVYEPLKLEQQVAVFSSNPGVELVYGRTLIWSGWAESADGSRDFCYDLGVPPDRRYDPPRLFNLLLRNRAQTPTTCNAMMTKALVNRVGGFDDAFRGLFEDQVFFAKALLAAPAWVDGRIWARYRQHPASCTASHPGGAEERRLRRRYMDVVGAHLAQSGSAPIGARLGLLRARFDARFQAVRDALRASRFDGRRA